MRRRGRKLGIRDGRTGAVTFIQRFGSALNLNPHLHSLLPDGLFVPAPEPGRPLVFTPLPPPTDQEIEALTEKIADRLKKVAVAAGVGGDEAIEPEGEQLLLAQSMAEALPSPLSPSFFDTMPRQPVRKPLCANVEGYGLHAARIVAAYDRAGLDVLWIQLQLFASKLLQNDIGNGGQEKRPIDGTRPEERIHDGNETSV
ncbi:MAG: transposase [Pseudomonadota bacterium]